MKKLYINYTSILNIRTFFNFDIHAILILLF